MTPTSETLVLIGLVIIVSYYVGRGARFIRLPALIGYMLMGVILGESGLNLFNESILSQLSFITDLALGFVGFLIGTELNITSLKRQGRGIVSIIFFESFLAFLAVFVVVFLFTKDLPEALIFGALAPASAPAGTVAVIQEYRAKGSLTKALYTVVGFDDGLAIIIYGFAGAFAYSLLTREASGVGSGIVKQLITPIWQISLSIAIGTVSGFVFGYLISKIKTPDGIFAIVFGLIFATTGLSVIMHISLILTNMTIGFVIANTRREKLVEKVGKRIGAIMPVVFILFFSLAGAHLKLGVLPHLGVIGMLYFFARAVGLIGGARLGAIVGKIGGNVRKYLGLGILSQAGVAIGLALLVKQDFAKIGGEHAISIGNVAIITITATSILFEIIGPILTKIALEKSGEIQEEAKPPRK